MNGELLEIKPEFMGFHNGDYPGAFPPKVSERIRKIVESPCLHLFSGSSRIGDVRIDLTHPNATDKMDVFDFVAIDDRNWKFAVLDPPYQINDPNKVQNYADKTAISSNVPKRRILEAFFQNRAENVLWFDFCSPRPSGFYRHKFWVYLQGGYRNVRVLTWLKREGQRLELL